MSKRQKEFLSISPGNKNGVAVVNGDIGFALRMFKRTCKRSGTLYENKRRQHFEKPSAVKRRKKLHAVFLEQVSVRRRNQ